MYLFYFLVVSLQSMGDIGIALTHVEGETDIVSKNGIGCASDFTASKGHAFSGLGFANHCPFFDPTDVAEDSRKTKMWAHFFLRDTSIDLQLGINSVETMARKLAQTIIVYNDLSKVSETRSLSSSALGKDRTVQSHHLDAMKMLFNDQLQTSTNRSGHTLQELGCPHGIATSISTPDGHFKDAQCHARGIIEVKHNTDTPAECLRQGAAAATNLALAQVTFGVSVDDIVVPVVGSNGYLMQIGAVIMLKPSFPVFIMLSHVLDLTCDSMLLVAANILCCIRIMVLRPLVVISTHHHHHSASSTIIPQMILSREVFYHCKPLSEFFASTGSIQSSLFHLFKVMARLHSSNECRKYVIFPICVCEYEDNSDKTQIVFPKLDPSRYKMGLPDSPALRSSFLLKLEDAMTEFHKAGVAHIDLYLSNIMWCEEEESALEEVRLKIVDWDAAHFTHEQLSTEMQNRLYPRRDQVLEKAAKEDGKYGSSQEGGCCWSHEERMMYYDISLLRLLQRNVDNASLRARDKATLDQACVQVQIDYLFPQQKKHG